MAIDSAGYLAAFELLTEDFLRVCEFVEPVDANLGTYSHRLYELFLRACTEFESVCKDLLVQGGSSKPPTDMNVNDYKTLEATLKLDDIEVGFLMWRPSIGYVQPFKGWATAQPPLAWYKAHHNVKHNRSAGFDDASLANVRVAIGALYAVLIRGRVLQTRQTRGIGGSTQHRQEYRYDEHPFTIVTKT